MRRNWLSPCTWQRLKRNKQAILCVTQCCHRRAHARRSATSNMKPIQFISSVRTVCHNNDSRLSLYYAHVLFGRNGSTRFPFPPTFISRRECSLVFVCANIWMEREKAICNMNVCINGNTQRVMEAILRWKWTPPPTTAACPHCHCACEWMRCVRVLPDVAKEENIPNHAICHLYSVLCTVLARHSMFRSSFRAKARRIDENIHTFFPRRSTLCSVQLSLPFTVWSYRHATRE